MAIIRWNPLHEMATWDISEIDRLFDRLMHGGTVDDGATCTWLPNVDILEEENEFKVHVDLPGVSKDDVKITVTKDVLTIRGEKKTEKQTEGKNYRRQERTFGSFQRSFTLPSMVKNDKIEATYDNGILTITLPKVEEAKPKEIEVKVK